MPVSQTPIREAMNHRDNSVQYQERYDWSKVRPSTAVIEAIRSVVEDDTMTGFHAEEFNLSQYIDLDAIDRLVVGRDTATVSFQIAEYAVQIDRDSISVKRILS